MYACLHSISLHWTCATLSRRRASQLTDCSEAPHSDQHLYSASAVKPAGVQPICAGLCGLNLEKHTNRLGVDLDTCWFVQYGMTTQPYEFTRGSIFHLMEPDLNQEIYGLPEYLSAIPSAQLNESATLFRRKYYINGSHAGFIMYMRDAAQNQEDVNNIRQAMKSAKGPGNLRNLFMYSPNGKKDGIQIIPLSEVAAKDEFLNIKNVSRDDMMAAHRVPPQMMGIMSSNVGGFGDVEKASLVFVRNELTPLQKKMMELNHWLDDLIIDFTPYKFE